MEKPTFISDSPMYDSQGVRWSDQHEAPESWEAPENGKTSLHTVAFGSRVSVVQDGRGPYLDDGSPDIANGAVPRHTLTGVYDRIDEQMVDDGLYEKFAIIRDDEGKEHWVALKKFRSSLNEEGKFVLSGEIDLNYYATGVDVLDS